MQVITRSGSTWWQKGVIYQIYPRSFADAAGDGVGDLEGVIGRIDYLVDLGVDAAWLSPIFLSPMADFGYDIADHRAIDPLFGDMATFDRLVEVVHGRGLRLILDYVPNHTSVAHPWFVESRASRTSRRRDWYVWRDGRDGGPPNNWLSEFGGPAWTLDATTGQYFYHAFLADQPDLNWRNPEVRSAMIEVMDFWLDRGVDGFRVDAIHHLFEDEALRDNPANPDWTEADPEPERILRRHTVDQPEVHGPVAQMRRLTERYDGARVLIGEAYLPLDRLMTYYGGAGDGFHLPFNFHLMTTDWKPRAIAELVVRYEACLPQHGWPNWVLSNHDRSRLASRLGRDQARVAAMLLLTLRGTPTLYQGDELGMTDVEIPPERVRDPWEINLPGQGLGRDPVRTPMMWTRDPQAGFTTGEPWLPLSPDWRDLNVEAQSVDPDSMLHLYRRLLALRRATPALHSGDFALRHADDRLLIYDRAGASRTVTVVLNLSGETVEVPGVEGTVVLATGPNAHRLRGAVLTLSPHAGLIVAPRET